MFTTKTQIEKTVLDYVIDDLMLAMAAEASDSDEYARMAAQFAKLYPLKDAERPKTISPDVVVTALANLAGIAAILYHERAGVITTKAIGFVMKLR